MNVDDIMAKYEAERKRINAEYDQRSEELRKRHAEETRKLLWTIFIFAIFVLVVGPAVVILFGKYIEFLFHTLGM